MKSFTRIVSLVALALSFGAFDASADNAEDRIAQRVEAAEERFEKAVQRVAEKLEAALDKEIEEARSKGKLELLVTLQSQKNLYLEEGQIPRHSAVSRESKSYYQTTDREGDKLVKIYERAVMDYTKSDQLLAAENVKSRIEHLRPLTSLKTLDFGDHKYLLIEAVLPWHKAQAKYVEMGGYLACVNSPRENQLLQRLKGDHNAIWIGLTDEVEEGFWQWVDGSRLEYKNWAPGEPETNRGHNYGFLAGPGVWDDGPNEFGVIKAFVCEWDHEITRRRVKKSSGSNGSDPDEVELLKTSTLKHNERVVVERKQLQEAILAADEEEAIVDAKSDYKRKVTAIKQDYINELTGVLNRSLEEDRLEIASKIKTQILRVKSQIEDLSRGDTEPDVPAIDDGGEETEQPGPGPEDPEVENPGDEPSDEDGGGSGFFGLPLE